LSSFAVVSNLDQAPDVLTNHSSLYWRIAASMTDTSQLDRQYNVPLCHCLQALELTAGALVTRPAAVCGSDPAAIEPSASAATCRSKLIKAFLSTSIRFTW